MSFEDELDGFLQEMGREHRAIEAPAHLEVALRAEARLRAAPQNRTASARWINLRPAWLWGLGVVMASLAIGGGIAWRMQTRQESQARSVQLRQPAAEPLQALAAAPEDKAPVRRETAKIVPPQPKPPSASNAGSLEVFIPLPVSEGLPPANELSLVRVRLLGSDLQQYGLEAPADAAAKTLLAEFVVGEDGLPRAIRIVP